MLHFAGKSDDHGHAEGDWHIPDGLKGQFSLDLQQEPPTENMIAASQEIERQGLMTSTGRKLWIELKIVTPEQALVKIPARLDMTIEDLKAAIMKSKRFFCLDELASTKNFAPALKNCGSKLSTINAMHSQLRFELSREKKKPHHRTLDGLALENAKPLSYYNIQNGTTLHMHLQMPITIISPTMVNPIPTNLHSLTHPSGKTSSCTHAPFTLQVYPTDTVSQVKTQISLYLASQIKLAHKNLENETQGKDSNLD